MQISNNMNVGSTNFKAIYPCRETMNALYKMPEPHAKIQEFTKLAINSTQKTRNVHLAWLPDFSYGLVVPKNLVEYIYKTKRGTLPAIINKNDELQIFDDGIEPDYLIEKQPFNYQILAPYTSRDLAYLHLKNITNKKMTTQMLISLAERLDNLININLQKKDEDNSVNSFVSKIFNNALHELENMEVRNCNNEHIEEFANLKYNDRAGRKKLFSNLTKINSIEGSDISLSEIATITDSIARIFPSSEEKFLNSDILYKPLASIKINEFIDFVIQNDENNIWDKETIKSYEFISSLIPDDLTIIDAIKMMKDLPIDILQMENFNLDKLNPKDNILNIIIQQHLNSQF